MAKRRITTNVAMATIVKYPNIVVGSSSIFTTSGDFTRFKSMLPNCKVLVKEIYKRSTS